jgi:lysophospholipase L1-like esterase
MSNFKILSGKKVVLIGDSITDCGRRGDFCPLGNGYVSIAVNLVTARYPERKIEWINRGIGGDVVQGLANRWTTDVIDENPDWVSVAIGINNVARDHGSNRSLKECLKDFHDSYRRILHRTREETDAKLIMFEVLYIAEEDMQKRDLNVDVYNEIIHRLSAEFNAVLVPVNTAFRGAVSRRPGCNWTSGDGVHPLQIGHTLIALTFLEALEW